MIKMNIDNIEVEVTKKKIKNIYLSIDSKTGAVKLSAPKIIKDEQIMDFLISKKDWINKHLDKLEKPQEYTQGNTINFLGEKYILNIIPYHKNHVEIRDGFLDAYIKNEVNETNIESIILKWYREQLKILLGDLVYKWEASMNLKVSEYRVKQMKTRWGSCNPKAKRIWFNLDLIKKSLEEIEYVVVHEMAHFLQGGHGKEFKAIMDKYYPSWVTTRNKLNNKL